MCSDGWKKLALVFKARCQGCLWGFVSIKDERQIYLLCLIIPLHITPVTVINKWPGSDTGHHLSRENNIAAVSCLDASGQTQVQV